MPRMSTLAEIEAAAAALPPEEQRELIERLSGRVESAERERAEVLDDESEDIPTVAERYADFIGIADSEPSDLLENHKRYARQRLGVE